MLSEESLVLYLDTLGDCPSCQLVSVPRKCLLHNPQLDISVMLLKDTKTHTHTYTHTWKAFLLHVPVPPPPPGLAIDNQQAELCT